MRRHIAFGEESGRSAPKGSEDDPLFVQSIGKAMAVLAAFQRAQQPMSLTALAEATGLTRSAAQRIVHTFRELGYMERADGDRGFVPGVRLLDLSRDYLRMNPLIERAMPVLLDLRRNARERIDLSLFDDLRLVYAARLQSKRETFFATLVGHAVPTFCTSGGRAIMAHLSDEAVDDILERSDRRPFTDKTIVEPDEVRGKVAEARAHGYALAVEEVLVGEVAIGVAILSPTGPVAAIHLVGSLSEWTPEAFATRYAPLAVEAASAISRL